MSLLEKISELNLRIGFRFRNGLARYGNRFWVFGLLRSFGSFRFIIGFFLRESSNAMPEREEDAMSKKGRGLPCLRQNT